LASRKKSRKKSGITWKNQEKNIGLFPESAAELIFTVSELRPEERGHVGCKPENGHVQAKESVENPVNCWYC